MKACSLLSTVLVAVLAALFLTAPPASAATPTRIMALGDSITGSPGCWRALLWQHLENTGYTDIDFVGTLPAPGCGFPYDGDNEGHGGYLATNIANQNQLPGWLSATRPDVVLMHLGTNDVWSAIPTSTILSAYTKLLGQMRASNPSMKVLVAQILPMNPANCSACYQRVVYLDNAIPAWARANTTAQSPITVVDQWSGFSTSSDTVDGVHPNDSGNHKMESRWYPALTAVLAPGQPTSGNTYVGQQSGRCLDVTGQSQSNGAKTQLWDCNGQTNQRWTLTTAAELRVYDSKCLELPANAAAGTQAQIWDCTGGANQKWSYGSDGSIRNTQTGLCLDANGQGTANGTQVISWNCNSQANQKWTRR
jgi:mannan endo-1,4-beta-mannosidase